MMGSNHLTREVLPTVTTVSHFVMYEDTNMTARAISKLCGSLFLENERTIYAPLTSRKLRIAVLI